MTTKSSAPNNLFQQGLGLTNAVQSATDKIPEYQQYQNMLANGMGNTPEGRTQMLAMQDILRQKQSALPEYQAFQNFSQTTNYPSTPTPSNQPTLPPQIGQQMFGGAGGGSGLGSLGGGGGGGGQTNVSLNLQGSATMNPQGANQNRGYPGMNFASAQQQDQSRGTMMFAEGGPAQQVTQFQPTFSPAQRGIGSLPYQAPNVPAMESSPTDYNQSPQYAPTQQYGASATSYSAPAANPMTASWDSYSEGPKYKPPPVRDTFIPLPRVDPPTSEPPSWASNPGTSYNPLVNYDKYGTPLGRKDEPNRPDARPTYNDEGQISNTFDYFQDDEGTVKSIYDEDGIRKYNDDGSRVNEDAPAERREDVLARIQKEEPVFNNPASPITYDPVTQTYGETTPTPTLYNPATPSYLDNPAFTAPVAKDSGRDSGYFYDDEGNRRSVYDEDGYRRYNDDGSSLYDGGEKAGGLIRAYARGGSTPQGIASLGRGRDTMLVHMTPGEVRGLQQLALAHGGSLTINPHTGLVEAGFLSSMLPMLIGAGLTFVSGGALSPVAAAMMTGAGYGLATGDLKKGLMAGLGAYGGANLGAGLGELGAEALNEAGSKSFLASQSAADTALAQTVGGAGGALPGQVAELVPYSSAAGPEGFLASQKAADTALAQTVRQSGGALPGQVAELAPYNSLPKYADMNMAQRAGAMQKGLGSVNPFSDTFNKTAATSFLDKNKYQLAGAFAGPVMEAMKPQSMTPMNSEPDQYDRELARYHLAPNYQAYVPPRPNPYYRAVYAAEGGDVSRMASGGKPPTTPLSRKPNIPDVGIIPLDDITTARLSPDEAALIRMQAAARWANLMPYTPSKTAIKGLGDIGPPISMLANGGIAELPSEYAAGGKLLQGPGDGMSDSIPAVIKGPRPQRAALAQGEFVVPADVVSHLGNGSTDAGAKRLYAMMNNIRKARTGTKKQGKQINAAHFMPA